MLFYNVSSYIAVNPLESLRKFQIYLADNRNRVLCCAIVYRIILFSHIRFYAFLLWQFLLPVKYICVERLVGNMNCPVIYYPCMFCFILRYCLLGVFMPPTKNSTLFGELLYRRYKLCCVILYYYLLCFLITSWRLYRL